MTWRDQLCACCGCPMSRRNPGTCTNCDYETSWTPAQVATYKLGMQAGRAYLAGPAETAHAREREDVCGACGGRTINGRCRCER